MKSFIVRIYRNDSGDRRNFVGTVEDPDMEGKKAFTNLDELWSILNRSKAPGAAAQRTENRKRRGRVNAV